MYAILRYKTPEKFEKDFIAFYADSNIRQIKSLSFILLIVTLVVKLLGIFYGVKSLNFNGYDELTVLNYIEIIGSFLFFIASLSILKISNLSTSSKRNFTLFFILFILFISLSTSYITSNYNTKNTLTIFFIGVATVSLFLVIEYKQIIFFAILIGIAFFLSMVIPKISFEEKLLNTIVGLIIGAFMVSLSRYNYYYKSQNFVKLKELENQNLEIEKLNIEKNDILNFVAHDLRNPLNNIEGLSNLLISNKNHSIEAEMIVTSVKQAKEIINDLLEGIGINVINEQDYSIDISAILKLIIDKWRSNTQREIKFDNESATISININPSKLERVIDNLMNNCVKFSEDHQPILITLSTTINDVSIKIQDFGIGIPKELQKYIFNQFTKSGRVGLKGEKSIGLGLHISKKIIEEYKGQLLMSSEENKGTTFRIILPLI